MIHLPERPQLLLPESIKFYGHVQLFHRRNNKLLNVIDKFNLITNGGKDKILGVMFNGQTQINPWFIGLINNAGFSAVAATDTMGSHAGWAELTNYTEATRPEWTEDAPSVQSISNSTLVTFTINATVNVKGIFVTSNSTKSGTTGELWAATTFTSVIPAVNLDTIDVIYTVGIA